VPHTKSLVRQLAEIRKSFTGEATSVARLAVVDMLRHKPLARRQLAEVIHHNADANLLPPEARSLVVPDALRPEQRALETGLYHALSRIGFAAIRSARPQFDGLVVGVNDEAATLLLAELLPRQTEYGLVGVPGLRVRAYRRHIDLYLVGTTARVTLSTVLYRHWIEVIALFGHSDERHPAPLTESELAAIADEDPAAAIVPSALLRRPALFPGLLALCSHGPSWTVAASDDAARALAQPLGGRPDLLRERRLKLVGLPMLTTASL
jgi:hypothetical protein